MKEKKTHLYFDSEERRELLHSLVELKNQLIKQGRYTDPVDELIYKVTTAPVKRMKVRFAEKSEVPYLSKSCLQSVDIGGFLDAC